MMTDHSATGSPLPAEWGTDDDIEESMLGECHGCVSGTCLLAGSEFCEFECPFREGNW